MGVGKARQLTHPKKRRWESKKEGVGLEVGVIHSGLSALPLACWAVLGAVLVRL